ncbi:MAG: hypothetical protein ACLUPZ_13360 [Lachnospiraceae bacterium]
MRRKLNTWHGYPLSPLAVKSGFIDYYTVAEVTGAEPYDTYASEEGARILKDESKELVYYNKELDVYVLGVCHCGISWRLVCSSIPV